MLNAVSIVLKIKKYYDGAVFKVMLQDAKHNTNTSISDTFLNHREILSHLSVRFIFDHHGQELHFVATEL